MGIFNKKTSERFMTDSYIGVESDGCEKESDNMQIETIIKTLFLTTKPYRDGLEFRKWRDSFLHSITQELEGMNVDIDCFDIYVNEIDSQVMKDINDSYNQFYDNYSTICGIDSVNKGKIERFKEKKEYLNEDLIETKADLQELYDKKKALEGV